MNDLDKLTTEQLKTLPPPLQEALKTVPWRNSVQGIGASHGLDKEKTKTLETETLLIIYGFEPQENFKANLYRELGLDIKKIELKSAEAELVASNSQGGFTGLGQPYGSSSLEQAEKVKKVEEARIKFEEEKKKIDSIVKEIEDEVFSPVLLMADGLNSLNIPSPELEIALPEKEMLLPEHSESEIIVPTEPKRDISVFPSPGFGREEKPALDVEPEIEHKNINLLEKIPAPVSAMLQHTEIEKPKTFEPKDAPEPIQAKSIVEEHLSGAVTTTNTKYIGGIDPYREPLN